MENSIKIIFLGDNGEAVPNFAPVETGLHVNNLGQKGINALLKAYAESCVRNFQRTAQGEVSVSRVRIGDAQPDGRIVEFPLNL